MKRWSLRLSALSGVVVLGLIAIAQAQRSAPSDISDSGASPPAAPRDSFVPRPEPVAAGSAQVSDEPSRFNPDSSARGITGEDPATKRVNSPLRPASDSTVGGSDGIDRAAAPSDPFAPRDDSAGAPRRFTPSRESAEIPHDPAPVNDLRTPQSASPADAGSEFNSGNRYNNPIRNGVRPAAATAPATAFEDRDARPLNSGPVLGSALAPSSSSAAPLELPHADGRHGGRGDSNNGAANSPFGNESPTTNSVMKRGGKTNALRPLSNEPAPLETPSTTEGTGHPGTKQLEGAQSPRLTIEKVAPAEVQVGKAAKFEIKVRNEGSVAAQGVEIHDDVPKGTQLISTTPAASPGARGELVWSLGTIEPGQQVVAQLDLMPIAEGEIGSVASVTFRADASARTIATRPQLAVQVSAPKQVMIGEDAKLTIRLSNPGTGAASGIVISERVPAGLKHPAGNELEFEVGTLKPGESRQIELSLNAAQAGHVTNLLLARGEGNLKVDEKTEFDVVAPALAVAMTGPSRRYLERQATYTVSVSNPGTAPAKDVQLTTQLPKGLKFVKANNSGQFDPNTNTVTWSLDELPATETGSVTLVAVPIEVGEQKLRVLGKARQGLSDEKEQTVTVEGLASLAFDVQATDEAIEIGGETTYQIHVVNQGSKAASNVQIAAIFPPELKATRAEGPSRETVEDHRVQFEPLTRLAPKAEATFRIRAQALQAGDLRVRVQLLTDDAHQPVTKEESTRVYADQ